MSTNLGTSSLSSGSGIDVDTIVSNMVNAARAPERVWQNQQLKLQSQQAALNELSADLSALDSSVSKLTDPLGAFNGFTSESANNSVFTASATSGASAGQHSVVVTQLADKASYYSNTVGSISAAINGSISIKVGATDATSIPIDSSTDTLDKLASAINQKNLGVTASIVTDAKGARLVLTGNNTGDTNNVVVTGTGSLSFTQSTSAQNAKLTIDGVPVESVSNTVSGALASVTLNLQSASKDTPVSLTVKQDTAGVTSAINSFVNNYNTIIKAINTQFSYDATTNTAGALSGDASVRALQEQLLGQISYSSTTTGNISTLAALGITMGDDGTLALDSTKLSAAVNSDFANVKSFFQGDGTTGFASQFGVLMNGLTDSTTGSVIVDLQGNSDAQKTLTDQISDFEVQIAFKRQQWLDQFSKVDAILRQFPLQQQQLTAELNSLSSLK